MKSRGVTIRIFVMPILVGWALAGKGHGADERLPSTPDVQVERQLTALLAQLDSPRYEARQQAASRIEQLLTQPALAPQIAQCFESELLRTELSFEVRSRLRQWMGRLPKGAGKAPPDASPAEIGRLVDQLDDDSFGVRQGAADRLRWLAGNPRLTCDIMVRLKRRLTDSKISLETYRQLDAIWQIVRGQWLLSESACGALPTASDSELRGWVEDLVAGHTKLDDHDSNGELPTSTNSFLASPAVRQRLSVRQAAARQELLDILARDDQVARVKAALVARLDETLSAEARAAVQELITLTRPAMVAEFWENRTNPSQQHLLVDVPSKVVEGMKASHFDRIDDRVAHCVSGVSLSPGDYPVGVAFPHPLRTTAVFRLVNLPTPRRRMAYTYEVQRDPTQRLVELSRVTLDRFLTEKRPINDAEIGMLAQLDPKEVSRFSGRYFQLLDDALLADEEWSPLERDRPGGQSSRHGMICAQLALDGTKEAVPGLIDALQQNRFLPPTSLSPYRLPWLAALAIARRDPWPDVETWLAGLVEKSDDLVEGRAEGPELGATAASLLLKRRRELPGHFGLRPAGNSLLTHFGIEGFRFTSADGRKKVQSWWDHQAGRAAAP